MTRTAPFVPTASVLSVGSTLTMQVARLLEPRDQRTLGAKLRQIVRGWRALTEHLLHLCAHLLHHVGMTAEQRETPREQKRRRFMPSEHERDNFIAELTVRKAFTGVCIACFEQHPQQRGRRVGRRAR